MPVAERVVSFNIDIRPLVDYVLSNNELLDDIRIYSRRSRRIPPYYFINEWDERFITQEAIGTYRHILPFRGRYPQYFDSPFSFACSFQLCHAHQLPADK